MGDRGVKGEKAEGSVAWVLLAWVLLAWVYFAVILTLKLSAYF